MDRINESGLVIVLVPDNKKQNKTKTCSEHLPHWILYSPDKPSDTW